MKPSRIFLLLALVGMCLSAGSVANAAGRTGTHARLAELGAVPCPNSQFSCVTLTVPLDHLNPSDPRTIPVVFGILPASGERKGMFVTATGGPGTAGIALADYYSSYYSPRLFEHFDLVFFDQRGVGLSGGLTCPKATAPYYLADWRADTPRRAARLKQAAKRYAEKCAAETGHSELLPYLGTVQAVEDLEAFRAAMGDAKFWLYGESYATQYAQTYANAHGDRLAGMILDGTVDLTLAGVPYFEGAARSFQNTLVAALEKCASTPECRADFGGDPLAAYDSLAAQLARSKQKIAFPLGTGKRVARRFSWSNLEFVGIAQMYNQSGRMLFLRALAYAARDGDLVPLARWLYLDAAVDATTLAPTPDPSWSDAMYYNVECQDYGYFQGTSHQRADQYIAAVNPTIASGVRLSSVLWEDFPCTYWRDASQDLSRPPYWSAPGIPTLVLNALLDPITPIASARAVYAHLDDGYLITQRGGPHVLFGRGVACIDDLVTAFLVDDQVPPQRETECPGKIMSPYVPLAPADARAFESLLQALESAETEINYLPEYWYWDYVTPTRVGCPYRGALRFVPAGDQVKFSLERCAFSKGFEMTGTGYYDLGQDRFWLKLGVSGYQTCELEYNRVGLNASVQGSCAGSRADASGAVEPLVRPATDRFRCSPYSCRPIRTR